MSKEIESGGGTGLSEEGRWNGFGRGLSLPSAPSNEDKILPLVSDSFDPEALKVV